MDSHPASREAGLERLRAFLPKAGEDYAARRNYVPGTVSGLSPYVRHRLVSEEEIAREVLKRHGSGAEKFLQELCWRTYWKGWLELRPGIWGRYLEELRTLRGELSRDRSLSERVAAAEGGRTGLGFFDEWVAQLQDTGWLHNHVRMWFASLWIHTLRLPWQLGADFFLRHLLDGDPASNTLSWRWVCGLQTRGKTYRAAAENIARYTEGRLRPESIGSGEAPPIPEEPPPPPPGTLAPAQPPARGTKVVLVGTVEDLTPEQWGAAPRDVAGVVFLQAQVPGASERVVSFRERALEESAARCARFFEAPAAVLDPASAGAAERLRSLARAGEELLLMAPSTGLMPQGWESVLPEGARLRRLRRAWDGALWPHATHGFFRFREAIPDFLEGLR